MAEYKIRKRWSNGGLKKKSTKKSTTLHDFNAESLTDFIQNLITVKQGKNISQTYNSFFFYHSLQGKTPLDFQQFKTTFKGTLYRVSPRKYHPTSTTGSLIYGGRYLFDPLYNPD